MTPEERPRSMHAWIALALCFCGCVSAAPTAELPRRFTTAMLLCRDDYALVLGNIVEPPAKGDPRGPIEQATRVLLSRNQTLESIVGAGAALHASWPTTDTVYAVRELYVHTGPNVFEISVSRDAGATWSRIDTAPPGIIGVAFHTESLGFAWSEEAVFRTDDAGSTWTGVASPIVWLPRFHPTALTPGGDFWIAAGHGLEWQPGRNALIQVSQDMNTEVHLPDTKFRIWRMDAAADGSLWLLGDDGEKGDLILKRLGPGETVPSLIGELPPGAPTYFRILGSTVIVLYSPSEDFSGRRVLLVSRDEGASWERISLPDANIVEACAASADQMWLVNDRRQAYTLNVE